MAVLGRKPRSSRRPLSAVLTRLVVFLAVVAGAAVAHVLRANHEANRPGPLAEARIVDIPAGAGSRDIARQLAAEGVVASEPVLFAALAAARLIGEEPKAGEYEFPAGTTVRNVVGKLASGRVVLHKVSVPEGLTTHQALERVRGHEALAGDIVREPLEGGILPDTYVFRRGVQRQAIVDQMTAARDRVLAELWAGRSAGLPIATPEEAVILASIVEKETGVADERGRVAAVFVNRLRKNMRLQSDPTIIYGITLGKTRLDRPIRRSDIAEPTRWNTYRIDGLPPTPIANPGREALSAVLNPPATDELYFVADGTGGHAFATTLAAHQANVRKWREWLQARRDEQRAAEAEEKERLAEEEAAAGSEPEPAAEAAPVAEVAPDAGEDEAERPAGGRAVVVEVAGRSVPLPRPKPTRD